MRRDKKENQKSLIGLKRKRKNENKQPNKNPNKETHNKGKNSKNFLSVSKQTENSEANKKNYKNNFNFCLTVYPTEKDFEDPIKYFEKLWDQNKESTGIIKIIPPDGWKNFNSKIFDERIYPNIKNKQNTFETRIQTLNELLKGKVKNF